MKPATLLSSSIAKVVARALDVSAPRALAALEYADLLRRCGEAGALEETRVVHAHIAKHGMDCDRLVMNHLVECYGKCSALQEAWKVFVSVPFPNVFSWTMIINAFAQNGHFKEACWVFCRMDLEGTKPDKVVFLAVLDSCGGMEDLQQCRRIHSAIVLEGLGSEPMLQNCLVHIFGKCGSLEEAKQVFDGIQCRSLISWNAIISAHSQNDRSLEAMVLWQAMLLDGVKPDKVSFVTCIDVCADLLDLVQGRSLHQLAVSLGVDSDPVVGNTLVHLYGKCGDLQQARSLFQAMHLSNVVTWNALISGYAVHGHFDEAVMLFRLLDLEGLEPTKVTFVATLDACWKLEHAKLVHECLVNSARVAVDEVVGKTLLNMYSRCGALGDADQVFWDARECRRSVVVWNSIMSAYSQVGDWKSSLRLFTEMHVEGVRPDKFSLISALEACSNTGTLQHGKMLDLLLAEKNCLANDMFVQTAAVSFYGKCRRPDEARSVFHGMKSRDVVAWNAMLGACAQQQEQTWKELGFRMFLTMDLEGVQPNEVSFSAALDAAGRNLARGKALHREVQAQQLQSSSSVTMALLSMYGKCNEVEEAKNLFERMQPKDIICFNAMMSLLVSVGSDECLALFGQMQQEGLKPDSISLVLAMDACASLASLPRAKQVHSILKEAPLTRRDDLLLETSLVNMYGNCGSLTTAWKLFQAVEDCKKDVVCWNSVMSAYGRHGEGAVALWISRLMQQEGTRMDGVSVLTLLVACSHSGMIEEAVMVLGSMKHDHGLLPTREHLGSVVDLLGRCGRLREAEQVIGNFENDPATWRMLLSSCSVQGDVVAGGRAGALAARGTGTSSEVPYVLLARIAKQAAIRNT